MKPLQRIQVLYSSNFRTGLLLVLVFAGSMALSMPGFLQASETASLKLDEARKKVRAFNFKATTLDGKPVSMSQYRGKVVFLNFWATWCVPCRLEMPDMESLHKAMEGKAFVMLAVNISEPKVLVQKFVDDLKLSFTIVMDPEGEISESYMAANLPITYIIDKEGYIVRRAIGPRAWGGVAARELMEKFATE